MQFNSINEVEQFAAQNGIALSPADRAKIAAVQESEKARLTQLNPPAPRQWADRFNELYPRLLESIIAGGDTLLTFSKTIIVSLGVPVVLILLMAVEHHRLKAGIELFDANPTFAGFAAGALVFFNLVLELLIHHTEQAAAYHREQEQRWSLRLWAGNMAYRLGLGESWQARKLSPAAREQRMLKLLTFTILALALAGSMKDVIQSQPGAWYEALVSIIQDSSLIMMFTWLGGLFFAATAVLGVQVLSRYIAVKVVEIVQVMNDRQQTHTNPHAAEIESAGALVALAIVNERLNKKAVKITPVNPTSAALELPTPLYSPNHTYTNGHSVTE